MWWRGDFSVFAEHGLELREKWRVWFACEISRVQQSCTPYGKKALAGGGQKIKNQN
jgi:hypothetical protein